MQPTQAHRYRIAIECLDQAGGAPLAFEVRQQEDLLAFARHVSGSTAFGSNEALALAVGLKLFTGIMPGLHGDPLFTEIQPALRRFIGNLKSRIAAHS